MPWLRALDAYPASVVRNDLLDNGQPQPSAIFLTGADEGLEQSTTNRLGDSVAVICDIDFQNLLPGPNGDLNSPGIARHGLSGIEQQVVESALQFASVVPALAGTVGVDLDQDALKFWIGPDRVDRAFYYVFHASVDQRKGLARA